MIAKIILKVHVVLFLVTGALSALTLFPYKLHLDQMANNIAIDVANRNFTTKEDFLAISGHLNADPGDADANTFTLLTYKESNVDGVTKGSDAGEDGFRNSIQAGGTTGFADRLEVDSSSALLKNGGIDTVALNVDTIGPSGGDSLIVDYAGGSFDPLNNTDHLIDGMNGTNMLNSGKIVNRGVPFKVTLKSRFNFTITGLGFRWNIGIPIEGVSVGVTTQYYQYD